MNPMMQIQQYNSNGKTTYIMVLCTWILISINDKLDLLNYDLDAKILLDVLLSDELFSYTFKLIFQNISIKSI